MKFFPLVWSNLKRKKLRTPLTLLSILVAFVLFALWPRSSCLGGWSELAGADPCLIAPGDHPCNSCRSYLERLERIPGVAAVSHHLVRWHLSRLQEPVGTFP